MGSKKCVNVCMYVYPHSFSAPRSTTSRSQNKILITLTNKRFIEKEFGAYISYKIFERPDPWLRLKDISQSINSSIFNGSSSLPLVIYWRQEVTTAHSAVKQLLLDI